MDQGRVQAGPRAALYVPPGEAEAAGPLARARRRLGWMRNRWFGRAAAAGLPPAVLGAALPPPRPGRGAAAAREEIHPARTVAAPLPLTGQGRQALAADPGWFGFSFRDVPARAAAPTEVLTLAGARLLAGADAGGDFAPAILDAAGRSLDLREIRFRPFHAPLVGRAPDLRRRRAVWIAERVFDNYAHWFTAHLGKLVLLRDRGLLTDLVLPADRPAWLDASLARIGVAPADELARGGVLAADELVVVACDRFRPELLGPARDAAAGPAQQPGRPGLRQPPLRPRPAARGRGRADAAAFAPWLRGGGDGAAGLA